MSQVWANAAALPLRDGVVQCVVTSPPYWGLRDYKLEPTVWGGEAGCAHEWSEAPKRVERTESVRWQHTQGGGVTADGQRWANRHAKQGADADGKREWTTIRTGFCQSCGAWRGCLGLEPTPDLYVQHLVSIFREVRRVLRDDGTVWLNLGDSYANDGKWGGSSGGKHVTKLHGDTGIGRAKRQTGLKPKDLVGIPWMVAFALRADGWYLRSDIIWAKGYSFHPTTAGSCMPESVTDRPTRGHEYLFLLTKSAKYYYDAEAVKENGIFPAGTRAAKGSGEREGNRRGNAKHAAQDKNAAARRIVDRIGAHRDAGAPHGAGIGKMVEGPDGYAIYSGKRNLRSVWLINPKPFREAHFATFPPALVEPCIKAGSKPGDWVLDPFGGSGTMDLVATSLNRRAVSVDLQPAYHVIAQERRREALGMFA